MKQANRSTLHLFAEVTPPFLTKRLLVAFGIAFLFHFFLFSIFVIDLGHFFDGKGEPTVVAFAVDKGALLSLQNTSKKGVKVPDALIIERKNSPDLPFISFEEKEPLRMHEKETVDLYQLKEDATTGRSYGKFSFSQGIQLMSSAPKIQTSKPKHASLKFIASQKTQKIIWLTWLESTHDKSLDQMIERAAKTLSLQSLGNMPYYSGTLEVDFIP